MNGEYMEGELQCCDLSITLKFTWRYWGKPQWQPKFTPDTYRMTYKCRMLPLQLC